MKKRITLIIIGVLILLLLTNPTQSDFKGYVQLDKDRNDKDNAFWFSHDGKRTYYLLLFSVWKEQDKMGDKYGEMKEKTSIERNTTYIGIMKNFFVLHSDTIVYSNSGAVTLSEYMKKIEAEKRTQEDSIASVGRQ
jgi:hypothetical protein